MRWLRGALHEPLIQFMLAGAVLFMAASLHAEANAPQRIVVDQARVALLKQRYALQFGEPPSAERLQLLVDDYVREEALYRQALALGLDKGDEVVRRRLAQKMEFIGDSAVFAEAPSETALKDYYAVHAARYRAPGRATFSILYFSPDKGGEDAARNRASNALAELKAGRRPKDTDVFPDGGYFGSLDAASIQAIFGASPMTGAIDSVAERVWVGPVRSGLGWHLVRVESREKPQQRPFESVADQVRQDFQSDKQAEAKRAAMQALLKNYHIVRAYRLDAVATK